MIQLKVLSGKKAGTEMVIRHFPFQVGRSAECDLSLEEAGVWEKHFRIVPTSSDDFELFSEPNTSVVINGAAVQQSPLRNGEVIEVGLTKILFGFSPTRQKSLSFREWLTWVSLGLLVLGQIALILKLMN